MHCNQWLQLYTKACMVYSVKHVMVVQGHWFRIFGTNRKHVRHIAYDCQFSWFSLAPFRRFITANSRPKIATYSHFNFQAFIRGEPFRIQAWTLSGKNSNRPIRVGLRIGVRARGAAAPPDSGLAIIFRAKAKFFGQSQQPKMEIYI